MTLGGVRHAELHVKRISLGLSRSLCPPPASAPRSDPCRRCLIDLCFMLEQKRRATRGHEMCRGDARANEEVIKH